MNVHICDFCGEPLTYSPGVLFVGLRIGPGVELCEKCFEPHLKLLKERNANTEIIERRMRVKQASLNNS